MHRWLQAVRPAVLAMVAACAPVAAQQTSTPAAQPAGAASPAANPADVASPEAIVTALYDVISGPATQARDWDRFRSLFLPHARLNFMLTTSRGEEQMHDRSVEEFIQVVAPLYASGGGFWERDIGHRVDRFGNVAQVFTAYESRRTGPDGPVIGRGINSVQVVRHQGRWWVANLAWDTERPGNPIPPEYLGTQRD